MYTKIPLLHFQLQVDPLIGAIKSKLWKHQLLARGEKIAELKSEIRTGLLTTINYLRVLQETLKFQTSYY